MELGYYYYMSDPDTAIYYHLEAKTVAEKLGDDHRKSRALIETGRCYYALNDYTKAIEFNTLGKNIAEKNLKALKDTALIKQFKKLLASSTGYIATAYMRQSEYPAAIENYLKALKLNEELGNRSGQAANLGGIGIVYDEQGDYAKALKFYFMALKINEELGQKNGQSANLSNIGIVYYGERDYAKSLDYYNRALKINRETGNKINEGNNVVGIGNVYYEQNKLSEALTYFLMGEKLYEETASLPGLANAYTSIANVYATKADSAGAKGPVANGYNGKALDYYLKAMKINEELGNKNGLGMNYVNLGSHYRTLKKYKEAEDYFKRSFALAKELHSLEELKYVHESLSRLYAETNRHALALDHYILSVKYRDSLLNEESTRASIQQEMKFNFGKKAAADSLKADAEKKIIGVQLEHEQSQRYFLYGGLALVLVFAGFMFNRFKVTHKQKLIIEAKEKETQKQNEIISLQKHLVEEKQKEILDSIRYAKRIQSSLLPPEIMIEKALNKLQDPAKKKI